MADQITLEQRVAALEKEVRELKEQINASIKPVDWIERITGSMADFPEFEEVIRYGREMRRADREDFDKPSA